MFLPQGHRLRNDKYQLLHVLGEGGFSLTYRGDWKTEFQGTLGNIPTLIPVCIKEYFFKDFCRRNPNTGFIETISETGKEIFEKNKEKIIKEAHILSEIHHPNVVNVMEVFKQNNTVYIVMEFIAGRSMKQEVEQNGALSENKLKEYIYPIGQALEYIHEKNILHLDIKPSNILIDNEGNPKLIDFGISKRYDLSDDQETSTTLQAASKGYASIEQYDSEAMQVFSPRPDIYSLGATMYYLATGQVPTESILRATKGLTNPRELNSELSENTEKVILKAMSLNAADRYGTVMEMLLDLGYDPEADQIDLSSVDMDDDDHTKISELTYDADAEDETVIHPDVEKSLVAQRTRKSRNYMILNILLFIVLAAMLILIFKNDKARNNVSIPEVNVTATDSLNKPEPLPNPTDSVSEQPVENTEQNRKNQTDKPEKEEDPEKENYNKMLKTAKIAFEQTNYTEAIHYFKQAAIYKETPEIKQYIGLCEHELKKNEIQKKKDNYDIKMKFGNFAVVKKKSDDRWGAINEENGEEVIPCKYLAVLRSGENRLFQRDDDLYDKYSPAAQLLEAGIDGYDIEE
jgi:serine/threonine-protein kinase